MTEPVGSPVTPSTARIRDMQLRQVGEKLLY